MKYRAFIHFPFGPHPAPVAADDALDDGQAYTRALEFFLAVESLNHSTFTKPHLICSGILFTTGWGFFMSRKSGTFWRTSFLRGVWKKGLTLFLIITIS